MNGLIQNILLTSILIFMLDIAFIKFRSEYHDVKDIEKYISVSIILLSGVSFVASAFILIWI